MTQLARALQDQDLSLSVSLCDMLRDRYLPKPLVPVLFRYQYSLVQLFHEAGIKNMESSHPHKLLRQKNQTLRRQKILKYIACKVDTDPDKVIAIAKLVDAIGESKAFVRHSYKTNSATKQQDWREALRILDNWTPVHLPSTPETGSHTLQDGDIVSSTTENEIAALPPTPSTPPREVKAARNFLEQELSTWMTRLMKQLVHSHTQLIRTILNTAPQRFGIQPTVDMYLVLIEYYSLQGMDGYKDILGLIEKMSKDNVAWKHEHAVYHHLLRSLSYMPGNEARVDMVIEEMLANKLVPKEETMKAAVMCAAQSGDLQACSRYIHRMHQEWNLTITDRMKAILLYACAKRGDFDGAVEILTQLSQPGTGVRPKSLDPMKSSESVAEAPPPSSTVFADIEQTLSTRDLIDNSNVLLALINQTHARRDNKKQISQHFLKEEVSRVLELFTVITRDSNRVDTQLYTIMMQYLSTLPSPLPGMMFLYSEMRALKNAHPNNVTYRIMLEACAEQMDMDQATQLWNDMETANIPKDRHVRASYVKGWGRTGDLQAAERVTREGMLEQEMLERDHTWYQPASVAWNKRTTLDGLLTILEPHQSPIRPRTPVMIDVRVLHELMKAHKAHSNPERVYELYQEIESGKWGSRIRTNEHSLSIVLDACGSRDSTTKLVDQSISLVEQYLQKNRDRHLRLQGNPTGDLVKGQAPRSARNDVDGIDSSFGDHEVFDPESLPGTSSSLALSDFNYRLYYAMLGRHFRQRKMLEVWDDMMQWTKQPPSWLTLKLVTEALENVQWGATPIKRIRRQLKEKWPDMEWTGILSQHHGGGDAPGSFGFGYDSLDEDDSVGPGGRFWR